jgi:hypothetical protein
MYEHIRDENELAKWGVCAEEACCILDEWDEACAEWTEDAADARM